MKSLDENSYENKIETNAVSDRVASDEALEKIASYLDLASPDPEGFAKIMASVAKIIECKTKANDQLIKVLEMKKKYKPKVQKENDEVSEEELEQALEEVEM